MCTPLVYKEVIAFTINKPVMISEFSIKAIQQMKNKKLAL